MAHYIEPTEASQILAILAKILAKGLTDSQRDDVLRDLYFSSTFRNIKQELDFFDKLMDIYKSEQNLTFSLIIIRRIQATQIFHRDVGADLSQLQYLVKNMMLKNTLL